MAHPPESAASAPGTVARVAFLTPEFLTESQSSGGIGNYVAKMAAALRAAGIEVEVFVPSGTDQQLSYDGTLVHRVRAERSIVARVITRLAQWVVGYRAGVILHVMTARRLARALEVRHHERPFDIVQSSNHNLTGARVAQVEGRVHLVRISTSRRLYDRDRGRRDARMGDLVEALDVRSMRRADAVYAPSTFLAGHFRREHGLDVRVLRPPAELGGVPAAVVDDMLPHRYLVHFGSLGPRKGTETVAAALLEAWLDEPELRMVWVGPIAASTLARFRATWGANADKVTVLGLREKPEVYRVVQDAIASVLPSTVDNLPNTVIESLILGVPVIGSDGASIDELVEHGRNGLLVEIGCISALANAMVRVWRNDVPWATGGFELPAALNAMRPDRAVRSFLEFAGEVGLARTRNEEGGE